MYNQQIVNELLNEHDVSQVVVFCELEGHKYDLLFKENIAKDEVTHQEYQYERDWWMEKSKELKTRMS